MSLIVDASVAVKWFSEEEQSDLAETLLAGMEPLIAPDLVIAEIGNALWKKVTRKLLQPRQAVSAMADAPSFFEHLVPLGDLAARATEIAIELQHPIYDCFYLALAERERAPIVSADGKLLAAAKRMKGVEGRRL